MDRIVWDNSFSVGIEEIDEQHKKWISIINDLHDALMSGKNLGSITGKSLKAMEEYAHFHFSFEEEYLQKAGYPYLENHKKEMLQI